MVLVLCVLQPLVLFTTCRCCYTLVASNSLRPPLYPSSSGFTRYVGVLPFSPARCRYRAIPPSPAHMLYKTVLYLCIVIHWVIFCSRRHNTHSLIPRRRHHLVFPLLIPPGSLSSSSSLLHNIHNKLFIFHFQLCSPCLCTRRTNGTSPPSMCMYVHRR